MTRVRYEVFCGGRLLKVIEQIDVTPRFSRLRGGGTDFLDGQHYWKVDEQEIAEDVAQAMLARDQAGTEAAP